MDKLGEYAKDDCKMTEKVYDAMWGGDPHFPHWNLGDRGERVMTVISPPNRPTKPATVPYSGGNKPEPKLEWKVEELSSPGCTIRVSLVIDGVPSNCYVDNMGFSRSHFGNAKKMAKCVAKSKASILARYNLCKKESGRVEQ